jgi:CheY-like chemotaxis protein
VDISADCDLQPKEYKEYAITNQKKILCVDDHSDTCELIATILDAHKVTSAYSMADAVKQATAQKFDLYILDYHLPDGTGLELCLMLRAFDQDTPMLFATGSSSITEAQVITAGAQGLVRKGTPSFAAGLLVKVAELLDTKTLAMS